MDIPLKTSPQSYKSHAYKLWVLQQKKTINNVQTFPIFPISTRLLSDLFIIIYNYLSLQNVESFPRILKFKKNIGLSGLKKLVLILCFLFLFL